VKITTLDKSIWESEFEVKGPQVKVTGNKKTKIVFRAHVSEQESLANAKVSARQHCVYEGPYSEEMYGKSTQGNTMLKSMGFNAVVDNTGLSSFV